MRISRVEICCDSSATINMWTMILFSAVCTSSIQSAAAGANQTGTPAAFHDDFSLDRLDASKWNAADVKSAVNDELQYYSPGNVRTADGALVITVKGEAKGKANYTSGRVDTRDHYVFTYGRLEIRAKMPKGRGIWVSLWLAHYTCLPAVPCDKWPPAVSLVDFRGDRVNQIDSTVFLKANDSVLSANRQYSGPADLTETFHTYALYWSPTRLACSVDGQEYFSVDDPAKIPSEPMQLVMNVAVGGPYAGAPNASTQLPTQLLVESVDIVPIDKDAVTAPSTGAAKAPGSDAGHSAHYCLTALFSAVILSLTQPAFHRNR